MTLVNQTLPQVEIRELCMREGMQIESAAISIDDKLALLDLLGRSGLKEIEVGSFVSAKYTPQMACIEELLSRFLPRPGVRYTYLAMNERGFQRAAEFTPPLEPVAARHILSVHLCDTFIRRNANRAQAVELQAWPSRVAHAKRVGAQEAGVAVNAAFGSNFEGEFTHARLMEMIARGMQMWEEAGIPVTSVLLGDPMGWCLPHRVEMAVAEVIDRWPSVTTFNLHLHNSRGMALASIYAALRVTDRRHALVLDAAAGGVGGCPYNGNGRATGMAATEDLVVMLEEMGVETGVNLTMLIEAVSLLERMIGRPAYGHTSKTGPLPRGEALYDPNLPFVETFAEARHFVDGPQACAYQMRPWSDPIPRPSSAA